MGLLKSLLVIILIFIAGEARAQFTQQGGKLVGAGAANGTSGSFQGSSVSISGDGNTAIVGGFADSNEAGAAWVFTRTSSFWSQQGTKLVGTGAAGNARQGTAVAVSADGNTVVVGGVLDSGQAGAAWVFTRIGGVWTQQGGKLVGDGGVGHQGQGGAVSLSADGNTAIVGGMFDDSLTGAAWVFTRTGSVWNQQGGKLVGSGAVGRALQGVSVSLSSDGNTALVGGYADSGYVGAAWVFTRTGRVWAQQGRKLVGTGTMGSSRQGNSVALSGDGNTAMLGGYADDSLKGAVWVFTQVNGIWSQQGAKLIGSGAVNGVLGAFQGYSVSLSSNGNSAIVGGYPDDNFAGAAWVYTRSGGVWSQLGSKLVASGSTGNPELGVSVSLSSDGKTALVGGFADDTLKGAAWVFTRTVSGVRSPGEGSPLQFGLAQNYPNPFNPTTTIKFELPKALQVSLTVFDMLGRQVSVLLNEKRDAGIYEVEFEGSNLASGVYFYRLQAGDPSTSSGRFFTQTKRLLLLK
ncbi:MAG TPA: T9SS type A sorting domain-containing protein [Bacteroidota bacterium]|nr:T9SS type A sorting domain-containing protein [Bacteroidota bacterium]